MIVKVCISCVADRRAVSEGALYAVLRVFELVEGDFLVATKFKPTHLLCKGKNFSFLLRFISPALDLFLHLVFFEASIVAVPGIIAWTDHRQNVFLLATFAVPFANLFEVSVLKLEVR